MHGRVSTTTLHTVAVVSPSHLTLKVMFNQPFQNLANLQRLNAFRMHAKGYEKHIPFGMITFSLLLASADSQKCTNEGHFKDWRT